MVERAKKRRKGTISEEDVSTLFQRYTVTTVLQLLQEVAQVAGGRIDWNALVRKTTTGISNAREYQMLWRHLAYRDALLQREDEAKPVDDDSDLDYELEAFPSVSSEASAEAAACVKVLIASGSQNDTSLPNGSTVEAPLTINIPNGLSSRAPSDNSQPASLMQGTNITVPVSVQKQPLPTVTSAEGLEVNGSASGTLPARRKRKPWSAAEDMELIAAVQKCGEGNWANILKGDFKGDRTASQLSQRWAIIRKRQGNLNVGGGSSQLSEAQLAARRAVSLALNMPMGDNLKAACSNAGMNSNTTACNSGHPTAPEASGSVPTTAQGMGIPVPSMKFRLTTKKTPTKSALSPDAMVKAAAVAAGARIATPSDAASLLKAAQAKNAVRIMPGSGSLIKSSSTTGNPNPLPGTHLGAHPNVHYMRIGPTVPQNASRIGGTQQVQGQYVESAVTTVQHGTTSVSAEVTKAVSSSVGCVAIEVEAKTIEDNTILDSSDAAEEQVQEDQGLISSEEPPSEQSQEDQGNAPKEQVEEDLALISGSAPNDTIQKCQMELVGDLEFSGAETGGSEKAIVIGNQAATENETAPDCKLMVEEGVEEMCVDQSVNGKQDDLIEMVMDGSDDKVEVLSKAAARTETEGDEHVRLT